MVQARMHGAEFDDEQGNKGKATQQTQSKSKQEPLFPDPKQFEHLSDEEKKQKTKELMSFHMQRTKGWL